LPYYAHVPMILGADGARLSKRHGAVSVMQYRDEGYLPQALLCYLVRLGWSHGDQELFRRDEMLSLFKLEDVSRGPSTFNPEKLLWVNAEFIKAMDDADLLAASQWYFEQAKIQIEDDAFASQVLGLIKERCKTLLDVVANSAYFFADQVELDASQVAKHIKPGSVDIVGALIEKLDPIKEWNAESIHACVQATVEQFEVGFAKVAQPVRIAVTGSTNSPSIDQTLALLGQEQTLSRMRAALPQFENHLRAK